MKYKGDRIFWDLDGVLRNLVFKFGCYVDAWDQVNGSGKTVMEHVAEDMSILVDAPLDDYAGLAKEFDPIHIVSAQPDTWRPNTSKWLDKHFPGAKVKYLTDTQHKLRYLEAGTRILIEDYPNYPDYTSIILVDRPYNKDTIAPHRVYSPEELRELLMKYLKDGSL
jgi:hypothetical protein